MLTSKIFLHNLIKIILIKGDLKDELDKEKESQTSIKRKIEEETKTTGKVYSIFKNKCVDCSRAALVSVEMSWKQNQYWNLILKYFKYWKKYTRIRARLFLTFFIESI